MKPKEITKWLLLLSVASSIVSSEYCGHDKTDIVSSERNAKFHHSTDKRIQVDDSRNLAFKPHSQKSTSTRESDFSRNHEPHRTNFLTEKRNIRTEEQQRTQLIRHNSRDIRRELNYESLARSREFRNAGSFNDRRNYRKSDYVTEVQPIRKFHRNQISRNAATLRYQDAMTREDIKMKSGSEIRLKENTPAQRENRRSNFQSERRFYKKQDKTSTLHDKSRIRDIVSSKNHKERNSIRRENIEAASKERFTFRERWNRNEKSYSGNLKFPLTENRVFFNNPSRRNLETLRTRSIDLDRNVNTFKNTRRLSGIERENDVHRKSISRRYNMQFTSERSQDITTPKESTRYVRNNLIEFSNINNNFLRRSIKHAERSLTTRDVSESISRRNEARVMRKESLSDRRIRVRNDAILRENPQSCMPRVSRFTNNISNDRSTGQNALEISTHRLFREEENSRFVSSSRTNRGKIILMSSENRKNRRTVEERKEKRSTLGERNTREHRINTNNVGRLSQEAISMEAVTYRQINYYPLQSDRNAKQRSVHDGMGTTSNDAVARRMNTRINRRVLNEESNRKYVGTRNSVKRNVPELAKRRAMERRNDRYNGRFAQSIFSEKEFDQSPQVKEIRHSDQRSAEFSKIKITIHSDRNQRHRQAEDLKIREVRNLERNTNFRYNMENDGRQSIQDYDRKISRIGRFQRLDRNLRRNSYTGMIQIRSVKSPKLREDNTPSSVHFERRIIHNRDDRMADAVRNRRIDAKNVELLSYEQSTLRNLRVSREVSRNVRSSIRNSENSLLNQDMQEITLESSRNGRGFRGKSYLLRRFATNRRMKLYEERESHSYHTLNYGNKISRGTTQNRIIRIEKNTRAFRLFDTASYRSGINYFNTAQNSEKRISGDELRQRDRRVLSEKSMTTERSGKPMTLSLRKQDKSIVSERNGFRFDVKKQNRFSMIARNGRGFRGKYTNYVRLERILKQEHNHKNMLLTVDHRKQDASLQAQHFNQVEKGIRFSASQRVTQKAFFDRNTIRDNRNSHRASLINSEKIRTNQRASLKNRENVNFIIFTAEHSTNRNTNSRRGYFVERTIPFKSRQSLSSSLLISSRRGNYMMPQSLLERRGVRLERYEREVGSRKTHQSRSSEETKLDDTRQRMLYYRLQEATLLPIHGALGSLYKPKNIIFENRIINSGLLPSSQEGLFNAKENWNMRNIFAWTSQIILGLLIVLAASEGDQLKCKSFKERLFDALSLKSAVF